ASSRIRSHPRGSPPCPEVIPRHRRPGLRCPVPASGIGNDQRAGSGNAWPNRGTAQRPRHLCDGGARALTSASRPEARRRQGEVDRRPSALTSHSPYVVEQFQPEQMMVLTRTAAGVLNASNIELQFATMSVDRYVVI